MRCDQMETWNYYGDHRVQAAMTAAWYDSIDPAAMTATMTTYDDDDVETEITVPMRYDVCGTCEGKGSHVNPSIDCGGLTGEDFDRDPSFAESYFSGMYDQPCNGCKGLRVEMVIDRSAAGKEMCALIDARIDDCYNDMRERADELRMGC